MDQRRGGRTQTAGVACPFVRSAELSGNCRPQARRTSYPISERCASMESSAPDAEPSSAGMAALIVAWSIGSETAPAFTTTQDGNSAVVTTLAPVFLTATSATPFRQLPQGTVVRVVSADAEWSRIEFNDLQLGRRIAFIRTRDLRTNAATPSAMIPSPRRGPPLSKSNAVSPQYPIGAIPREQRLTSEVTDCRGDLTTLAKAVGEASAAEEAVEAEGEFEDIKEELDDAVASEGRNCDGVVDRSYSSQRPGRRCEPLRGNSPSLIERCGREPSSSRKQLTECDAEWPAPCRIATRLSVVLIQSPVSVTRVDATDANGR